MGAEPQVVCRELAPCEQMKASRWLGKEPGGWGASGSPRGTTGASSGLGLIRGTGEVQG